MSSDGIPDNRSPVDSCDRKIPLDNIGIFEFMRRSNLSHLSETRCRRCVYKNKPCKHRR